MNVLKWFKTLGVTFLVLLVAGVWLTYAIFTQRFTDFREVTLETSNIGLQMPERADVKIRGMIVGEVRDRQTTADGAELTLGIYGDSLDEIPADVTGSIVPKTLFGQKEVELVMPEGGASDEPIREGATIERTVVGTEVEQVLNDLQPLLEAVPPGDINMTLNALVVALEGRGDQIGDNIERLDSYLGKLNPELPTLMEDLRLTAEVSDVYNDVIPEVSSILRNSVTTLGTLEGREARLQALLGDVSQLAGTTQTFLEDNGDSLIRVSELGPQQLETLARYAPQYPCLLGGIRGAGEDQAEAFRDFTLHINLELIPDQPRPYEPSEVPQLGADNGPYCGQLPDPPYNQDNRFTDIPDFDDGIRDGDLRGDGPRVAPGAAVSGDAVGGDAVDGDAVDGDAVDGARASAPRYTTDGTGLVGSASETAMLKGLLAPTMGTTAERVPDLGALLLGPMARGAEVELR